MGRSRAAATHETPYSQVIISSVLAGAVALVVSIVTLVGRGETMVDAMATGMAAGAGAFAISAVLLLAMYQLLSYVRQR